MMLIITNQMLGCRATDCVRVYIYIDIYIHICAFKALKIYQHPMILLIVAGQKWVIIKMLLFVSLWGPNDAISSSKRFMKTQGSWFEFSRSQQECRN